jgi:hypothetical protein
MILKALNTRDSGVPLRLESDDCLASTRVAGPARVKERVSESEAGGAFVMAYPAIIALICCCCVRTRNLDYSVQILRKQASRSRCRWLSQVPLELPVRVGCSRFVGGICSFLSGFTLCVVKRV